MNTCPRTALLLCSTAFSTFTSLAAVPATAASALPGPIASAASAAARVPSAASAARVPFVRPVHMGAPFSNHSMAGAAADNLPPARNRSGAIQQAAQKSKVATERLRIDHAGALSICKAKPAEEVRHCLELAEAANTQTRTAIKSAHDKALGDAKAMQN